MYVLGNPLVFGLSIIESLLKIDPKSHYPFHFFHALLSHFIYFSILGKPLNYNRGGLLDLTDFSLLKNSFIIDQKSPPLKKKKKRIL